MERPSDHLTWAELACKDGTPYPDAFVEDGRVDDLCRLFEAIRALLGHRQLTVLSAYRTPAHNRSIGGARDSQHVQGRALDLRPPAGRTPFEMYSAIRAAKADGHLPDLGGIGLYNTFVHVDCRARVEGRPLAVWNGGNQVKDDTEA